MQNFFRAGNAGILPARALLLLLLLLLVCPAHAEVRESDEPLADLPVRRVLERAHEVWLNFPGKLAGPEDVFVVFTAGATHLRMTVIARPGTDPIRLAQQVEDAIADTALTQNPVKWDAGDTPTAEAGFAVPQFGLMHAALDQPIGQLLTALRGQGYHPHAVLRLPLYAETPPLKLPEAATPNSRLIDLHEAPADLVVPVQARLSLWDVVATVLFLFMVPLVGGVGLLVGISFGRRTSIPIEVRRRLYPKLTLWPTFAAIGLHLPLTLLFLYSPMPRRVLDLWSGDSQFTSFTPFFLLPLFALPFLLPISRRVERSLFGAPEQPVIRAQPSPEEIANRMQIGRWGCLPFLVGMLFWLSPGLLGLHRDPPVRFALQMTGMVCAIFGPQLLRLILHRRGLLHDLRKPDATLTERARTLAERMQTGVHEVRVDHSVLGHEMAGAWIGLDGRITLTHRLADVLDADEMDFILAHELVHRRRGHTLRRLLLVMAGTLLVALPTIVLGAGLMQGFWAPAFALLTMIGGLLVAFVGTRLLTRHHEFVADREALRITGNLAAAESALVKVVRNTPMPHLHEVPELTAHPILSRRLRALREAAARSGQ